MQLIRFYDNFFLGRTASVLIALVFCQPVFTSIPVFLHIPTEPFSVFFRLLIVLFSLYIIFAYFFTRKNIIFFVSISFIFLILFWVLYSIRLIYDISIRGIVYDGGDALFVYSVAFGNQLLPLIAIGLIGRYIQSKILVRYLYIAFVLSCFAALGLVVVFFGTNIQAFSNRGLLNSLGIQVIKLSFDGQILVVMSTYLLIFKKELSIWRKIILLVFLCSGFLALLAGASRSPFFGMILGLLLVIITYLFAHGFKIFKIIRALLVSFLTLAIIFIIYLKYLSNIRIDAFVRIISFIGYRSEGAIEIRDLEYEMAWNQFLRSPIFGDAFVEEFTNFYPHNIILELLMATGIVGALLVLFPISIIFKRSVSLFICFDRNKYEILLLVIFALILFLSLFSGGLFVNPIFWIMLAYLSIKSDLWYAS